MTDKDFSNATIKPTKETYGAFQQAYDALNRSLFKGELTIKHC